MTEISRDQAQAIAQAVTALRPDWQPQGIVKALGDARARGTAFEVAHAALYAAADPTNRTPAVIPLAGAHWARAKASSTQTGGDNMPGVTRCEVPGHEAERAHNCRSCQSERIAAPSMATTTAAQTTSSGISKARIAEIFETQGVVR